TAATFPDRGGTWFMSTRFLTPAALLAGLLALGGAPALRAGEKSCCPKPKLVQKVYQVADLVVPLDSSPAPCADVKPEPAAGPALRVEKTGCQVARKDLSKLLVKLLVTMIDPESWAEKGGPGQVDYFPLGMALVINQTPDVHEKIAELLT